MINQTYKLLFILPFLLLTSLSAQANPDIIWKKRADYVAISNLSGASENNHPKDIAVDKIARLLSQVQVINSSYSPSVILCGMIVRPRRFEYLLIVK